MDTLDQLLDLHTQAMTERSHHYTANVIGLAIWEIKELREVAQAAMTCRKVLQCKEQMNDVPAAPPWHLRDLFGALDTYWKWRELEPRPYGGSGSGWRKRKDTGDELRR